MPVWYTNWILAQEGDRIIDERPPEFVYEALQCRRQMLKIMEDPIRFCMINPDETARELTNIVANFQRNFGTLCYQTKEKASSVIRSLAIGIPAGEDIYGSY